MSLCKASSAFVSSRNPPVHPLQERLTRPQDDDEQPDMPDEVIIKMARASASHGSAFWTRFTGSCLLDGGDASRRDYNLLCSLAWWTRCNAAQMFNLFMQSGCVRDKTLSERGATTYLEQTIDRVIDACTSWRTWTFAAAPDADEDEMTEDEDEAVCNTAS
jgi:primase-polymerase (primpol)-like protein